MSRDLGPGVTPRRVYFTNWGVLAESIWDFDFEPGRVFLRKGEFELDSAIAMFWNPVTLEPGESVTWVTYYGLGGITIAPGKLSLGVTSPAVVSHAPDAPTRFPIVAYLENTGEGEARDVVISIQLPKGNPRLCPGAHQQPRQPDVGRSVQVAWQVEVAKRLRARPYEVRLRLPTRPNRVRRQVKIAKPAELQVKVSAPPRLLIEDGSLQPAPCSPGCHYQCVNGCSVGSRPMAGSLRLQLAPVRGGQAQRDLGPGGPSWFSGS